MMGHGPQRRSVKISLMAVLCLCSTIETAWADDAIQLATRLSTLRGEVEALSAEIGEKQTAYRAQLQGFARQEADLSLESRRGQTEITKLRVSLKTARDQNAARASASEVLDTTLSESLSLTERYVSESLPFKRKARLDALSKIRQKRHEKTLTSAQALNRLWAFLEDELRMQRESVLYRQEITIEGQTVLADVLRVGMVMMFYRLKASDVGFAHRTEDGWVYASSDDPEEIKQIELAFDQFRKQVRVGTFVLPNKIIMQETGQ